MPDQEPQPSVSELASFGEELRREREIRGISLKEIADATKISKRFLDAIERNDHKTLPAPVFTRGFVREYARYLGLNADEMVNRYNFAAVGDDRIEQSAHLERLTTPQAPPPERKKLPPKGIPPAYARVDRNVYILLIVVIALAGVSYWALKHRRETRANEERLAAETKVASAPVVSPPPAPVQTASTPAQPPAAVPAKLILSLEITRTSWITLDSDGERLINDELHRGFHRTVEAKDGFRFKTIGNAAGVAMTLNDVPVPSLGHDGQVLHDVVFDRAALQKLQTPSTAAQQ
jgi:transcriptional regulator with XRE-family HTH domain